MDQQMVRWGHARLQAMILLAAEGLESWIEPVPWDQPITLSAAEAEALTLLKALKRLKLLGKGAKA